MLRFSCFALCSVLLSAPCLASEQARADAAQQASSDPLSSKEQAQVLFERGIQEFRAKRYKDAIDAFLLANELYPSSAISFNIARAYEGLQDPPGALRFYRDYLRRTPAASDSAEISKRIEVLEDRLRQRGVQQVTILSTPAGATLYVDGRAVGITPWTGEILPGNHGVQLVLRGYADEREQFALSAHRSVELEYELEPLAADPAPASASETKPPPSAAPEAAPAAPVQASPPSRPTLMSYLPWVSLGAGAAALAGAGYFEISSAKAEERARSAPTQPQALGHIGDMQTAQLTARVLVGVSGALAATGGVLLWLHSSDSERPATLAVGCGVIGCSARGSF